MILIFVLYIYYVWSNNVISITDSSVIYSFPTINGRTQEIIPINSIQQITITKERNADKFDYGDILIKIVDVTEIRTFTKFQHPERLQEEFDKITSSEFLSETAPGKYRRRSSSVITSDTLYYSITQRRKHILHQKLIKSNNLQEIDRQIALYGSIDVPIKLINEKKRLSREIAAINRELKKLGD